MKVWAFDLDGCLVENHNDFTIYARNDPTPLLNARVREGTARIAREAAARGDFVVVVTGRQRGVREATLSSLRAIFGLRQNVVLCDLDDDEKWTHARAIAHKTACLRAWQPNAFFGDRLDFDKVAADAAGIPFIHTKVEDPRWD